MTELSSRDAAIIRLVSRLKLVTTNHVHELLFSTSSRTPIDRAMRRLTEQGFLHRVERRLVGGSRGGSGQYCYGLGRRSFYMHHTGRYSPVRTVQHHALAIADLYVLLHRLQRSGQVELAGVSNEPDCWVQLGEFELKPDMYAEMTRSDGVLIRAFYEVDMATEGQKQVRAKLEAVVRAYRASGDHGWTFWPRTIWVCVDDERQKEVAWLVGQMPEEAQALFRVTTLAGLPEMMGLAYPQV